jgi:DNA/RNA endonuclease YhcR with UshA esterase domain
MKRLATLSSLTTIGLLYTILAFGAERTLTAEQARDHIGEHATVCGTVASARYASSSRGQPTFLNLDKPYPEQLFTVIIWGQNRAKFGAPETDLRGKRICVSGLIESYRGVPEIEARQPSQITVPR